MNEAEKEQRDLSTESLGKTFILTQKDQSIDLTTSFQSQMRASAEEEAEASVKVGRLEENNFTTSPSIFLDKDWQSEGKVSKATPGTSRSTMSILDEVSSKQLYF